MDASLDSVREPVPAAPHTPKGKRMTEQGSHSNGLGTHKGSYSTRIQDFWNPEAGRNIGSTGQAAYFPTFDLKFLIIVTADLETRW